MSAPTSEQYPAGLLPTFSPPQSQKLDPPLPEDENTQPLNVVEKATPNPPRRLFGLAAPKQDPSGTPTATYSTGDKPKADLKLTGDLVAAVLGLGFLGAAALVRIRRGRKLRQPTKKHLAGMGEPLGRIAARHIDASWLNADLVDLVEAGSALSAYLAEAPLTVHDTPDPNIPQDLQEEQYQ